MPAPDLTLVQFTFVHGGKKYSHALLGIPVVPLSIYDFKMTGLLSVFSLLSIQNQKKRVNGQEEDLQVRDSEGLERKQDNEGKVTLHDVSGSTDSGR